MKWLFLIIYLLASLVTMGQDSPSKWYHTAKVDLLMPTKTTYTYDDNTGTGKIELDSKLAVRLLYSYNHWVIKGKFGAGLLAGVHFFTNPQLSLLDLGGQFRISILEDINANMLLQLVYQQPFDGAKTNGGLGADIGLEISVYEWAGHDVLAGIGLGSGLFDMKRTGYKSSKVQGEQYSEFVKYNSFNLSVSLRF